MPPRPRDLPTTAERPRARAPEKKPAGPVFLAAYPRQVRVDIPASTTEVGRAWLHDAGIEDAEISRTHVRLARRGARVELSDVGSRHGTFVDGERLAAREPVALEDGSIVRLGRTLLVFRAAWDGPSTAAPPLGRLVAPWGLGRVREALARLTRQTSCEALNVLVLGATGTGKELVAKAVACATKRQSAYATVNVAAIPREVFEGQLFGWKRGAFSGSAQDNPGILRAHDHGAVFLDEIGDLSAELQPKLLRLLENREVLALGATTPSVVDLVLIAATHRDLRERIESNDFREDLLARFQTRIELPTLAERPEDLFAILDALWRARHDEPLSLDRAPAEIVELLMLRDFPGNIRDLARVVAAADPADGLTRALLDDVLGPVARTKAPPLTREAIARALAAHDGNKSRAADALGVSRGRLLRELKAREPG